MPYKFFASHALAQENISKGKVYKHEPESPHKGDVYKNEYGSYYVWYQGEWHLTGPLKGVEKLAKLEVEIDELEKQIEKKRKQMKKLEHEGCTHKFDDGSCATETVFIMERCVICGR